MTAGARRVVLYNRSSTAAFPRLALHGWFSTAASGQRVLGSVAPLLALTVLAACGKSGPPLPPLHIVPEAPTQVTLHRIDGQAVLKLTLPKKNANGPGVDLDRVEIYAVTAAPGAVPPDREVMTRDNLVGTISVKPPPAEDAPPDPKAAEDKRPSPGDIVTFTEELTADRLTPEPPKPEPVTKKPAAAAQAVATTSYPIRIYAVRGRTKGGRPGAAASRLQLPLVPLPPPPVALITMFDEKGVLIAWMPPVVEDAAFMSVLPNVTIDKLLADVTGDAEAPIEVTRAVLAALPAVPAAVLTNPLASARPASPGAAATAAAPTQVPLEFNVYAAGGDAPLNTAPASTGWFQHGGAEVGKEQCFAVRTMKTIAGVGIEGEPSAPACVTPRDIFAPSAPTGLNAVAGPGAINLIWNANNEPDVAGYIVLRGEVPGGTLQPLTPAPIRETNYRDATVTPGTRYVYVVVAVDTATPPNVSAQTTRVEETAR